MIDPDIIEKYSVEQQALIKSALITLSTSGVFTTQLSRLASRLVDGSAEQPVDELVQGIREYRWKAAGLRTLQLLGESFLEERKS